MVVGVGWMGLSSATMNDYCDDTSHNSGSGHKESAISLFVKPNYHIQEDKNF